MNQTPIAQRIHISFFGCTNAGKSSLVNAITSQNLSIVSDIKGTTTDPVKKTMELLPLGPVVLFDTPGFDDKSTLGELRIEKTNEILAKTDIAILVVDACVGLNDFDNQLIDSFKNRNLPYIIAYNKADLAGMSPINSDNEIFVSAENNLNIKELKEKIAALALKNKQEKYILKDKIKRGDSVVLVIPIDDAAPKGRIILPQQNTLRELLDIGAITICSQVQELSQTLANLKEAPKLVITDSQAFNEVKKIVPNDIKLTSFSILFARYKGELDILARGAKAIDSLKDNDTILISEGCTHHRQCNDIGSVKFPSWLEKYTGKKLNYEFTSGGTFPTDLSKFALIIHCGGCMLNDTEMKNRINIAISQGKNIVNYGIAIAYMNGILPRALEIFPEIKGLLDV